MTFLIPFLASLLFLTPPQDQLNATINKLDLSSQHYILYSKDADAVIAQKGADKKVSIASIQKNLTLITALELLKDTPLSTEITLTMDVFDGLDYEASVAGFWAHETLTIEDILMGVTVPSGADATRAISFYLTGDPEGLVKEMNLLAKRIGMTHTQVSNTSGLDDENQYSTLNDQIVLLKYALENETFKKIYTTESYTTSKTRQHPEGLLFENNILVNPMRQDFKEIYGAKSGYTDKAGRALSSIATNGHQEYYFISTNATVSRSFNYALSDAIKVYDSMFKNYDVKTIVEKGQLIDTLSVKHASSKVNLYAQNDIKGLINNKVAIEDISSSIAYAQEQYQAPMVAGTDLGIWELSYKDEAIFSVPYALTQQINASFLAVFISALQGIFKAILLILGLFATLIGIVYIMHRHDLKSRRM